MARSPDEIDFKQYYEDWRHRDNLTWQIVAIAISGMIIVGSYRAGLPWQIGVLVFGLGAFFMATLTVMLAQNLYYQWRDEKHLADYGEKGNEKPQPGKAGERDKKGFWNKLCHKSKLIEEYEGEEKDKPHSRPIPSITEEERKEKTFCNKLGRIIGSRRMGSTLLLFTCFSFYGGFTYLFASTWQWCHWPYWVGGISVPVITFLLTFGWFSLWLICIGRN